MSKFEVVKRKICEELDLRRRAYWNQYLSDGTDATWEKYKEAVDAHDRCLKLTHPEAK